MKLTSRQRLRAIDKLMETDTAFEADFYSTKKAKDPEAKEFAKMIMEIYSITHPHFSKCKHDDWDLETIKRYDIKRK